MTLEVEVRQPEANWIWDAHGKNQQIYGVRVRSIGDDFLSDKGQISNEALAEHFPEFTMRELTKFRTYLESFLWEQFGIELKEANTPKEPDTLELQN